MTIDQIKNQAVSVEAEVCQTVESLQYAVQTLAALTAELCDKLASIHANLEELNGRANE